MEEEVEDKTRLYPSRPTDEGRGVGEFCSAE